MELPKKPGLLSRVRLFVVRSSRWFSAVWPFLLILGLNILIAVVDQYNDILRRQVSTLLSAFFFSVVLALFGAALMRAADRSLCIAFDDNVDEVGKLRRATTLFFGALLVGTHALLLYKLFNDPITTLPPGFYLWAVGAPILGIYSLFLTIKHASPSLPPVLGIPRTPKEWGKPLFFWIYFSLLIVVGCLLANTEVLKAFSSVASRQCATITHVIFTTLVMSIAAFRYLGHKYRFPVIPSLLFGIFGISLIWTLLSKAGLDLVDIRGVELREPVAARTDAARALAAKPHAENDPIVIFIAEGGGIHAAYRAMTALAMIESELPGTCRKITATSTISGGSVGTAMFFALYSAPGPFNIEEKKELLDVVQMAGGADLLTPIMSRLAFSEPVGLIAPATGFDRGKALEIGMEAAVERFAPENILGKGLTELSTTDLPYFFFNTTSALGGDRMILSSVVPRYARSLGRYDHSQDVTLRSAATLSARFPLFPGSGRVTLKPEKGQDPPFDRLLDGGFFDNSGLTTALDLIYEMIDPNNDARPFTPTDKTAVPGVRKIVLIVVGNTIPFPDEEPIESVAANVAGGVIPPFEYKASEPTLARGSSLSALTAYAVGAAAILNNKNTESAMDLVRLSRHLGDGLQIINFKWNRQTMNAPLGWTMDEGRRRAMSWMMGCRTFQPDDPRLKPEALDTSSFPSDWNPKKAGSCEEVARRYRKHNRRELNDLRAILYPDKVALPN